MSQLKSQDRALHDTSGGKRTPTVESPLLSEDVSGAGPDVTAELTALAPAGRGPLVAGIDRASRILALNRMQQDLGNAYVQRLVASLQARTADVAIQRAALAVQRTPTPPTQAAQEAEAQQTIARLTTARDQMLTHANQTIRNTGRLLSSQGGQPARLRFDAMTLRSDNASILSARGENPSERAYYFYGPAQNNQHRHRPVTMGTINANTILIRGRSPGGTWQTTDQIMGTFTHEGSHILVASYGEHPGTSTDAGSFDRYKDEFRAYWIEPIGYWGSMPANDTKAAAIRTHLVGASATDTHGYPALRTHYWTDNAFKARVDNHKRPDGFNLTNSPNLDRLFNLLNDGDEDGAIALMGRLGTTEVPQALASARLRDMAVSTFNNDEMYRGVRAMRGDLVPSLQWMFAEGTDWGKVRDVIRRAPSGRDRVLSNTTFRGEFVSICDNEEMAEAVKLLEGPLVLKLQWMLAEGTDAELVYDVIRRAPMGDLQPVTRNSVVMEGLRDELSGSEYARVRQMLTQGLLHWEERDISTREQHYERESATEPWELETFNWDAEYEIQFRRTELRIIVRMELTGETVDATKRQEWLGGIRSRWNNQFRVENGRTLDIVFDPSLVTSNAHHTVRVHPGSGRANMTNWYAQDSADTAAHEFGHMIGLEDEYRLTAADYQRLVGEAPPPGPTPAEGYTATGLMGAGTGPVSGRHFRPFVAWLNARRGAGQPMYRLVRAS